MPPTKILPLNLAFQSWSSSYNDLLLSDGTYNVTKLLVVLPSGRLPGLRVFTLGSTTLHQICFKSLHPEKTLEPIDLRVSGSTNRLSFEQPLKALLPIAVTVYDRPSFPVIPEGISINSTSLSDTPVIVAFCVSVSY